MIDVNIRLGDLVFVTSAGFVPRAIEDITHSRYYHVAGLTAVNELVEAQGFRKTGYQALETYTGAADVYTCAILSDEQRTQITTYALKEIGTRYDYLLIGWEAVRYVLHLVLPFYEGKRRICSTLWSDAYRSTGVDLCPGIPYPSPADLATSPLLQKVGSY